jgi:hypothetical protein
MKQRFIALVYFLISVMPLFVADVVPGQECGDGICNEPETIENCPKDCFTPGISIRDLLNWDAMHDWTLEQLDWKENQRMTLPSGVTVIQGTWNAGPFTTFNAERNVQTIHLEEAATLYLPPNLSDSAAIPGIVQGVHVEGHVSRKSSLAKSLAKHMHVAVIRHGGMAKNYESLGFSGRQPLAGNMLKYAQVLNRNGFVDPITANFGLFLAKVNVLALTLLDRILEEEGSDLGDAAITGGSKEGYAAWIVSAVDARIHISMPGNFQLHDFITGFEAYEKNSGCGEAETDALYRSCVTTGAGGLNIRQLTEFKNWLVHTTSGQLYNDLFSPSSFVDLLYPNDILLYGDAGICGMHDGDNYTPGAETPFLESFTQREWRYDRRNVDHTEDGIQQRLVNLAWALTHDASISHIPKVQWASASVNGSSFSITAHIAPTPNAVKLWYSYSEDREFDDPDNRAWASLPMSFNDGHWYSEWIACPPGSQLGWYVEAEDEIVIKKNRIVLRDASPVKFLFDLPPLQCDMPVCYCELFPDNTTVSRGGTLGFEATVTNTTSFPGTAHVMISLSGNKNALNRPAVFPNKPFGVSLDAYESKSARFYKTIPDTFPLGTHTFRAFLGQYPGDAYDQCEFDFTITE